MVAGGKWALVMVSARVLYARECMMQIGQGVACESMIESRTERDISIF